MGPLIQPPIDDLETQDPVAGNFEGHEEYAALEGQIG
jgi:hypothetical protein